MGDTPRTVRLRGRIDSGVVRRGTASEHDAWVLVSAKHGRLLLKRLGGSAFEKGAPPAEPGSEVEAVGYLMGSEFRYTTLKRVG
ncbi:MAG TPA: hypothetical protein VFQ20_11650 [Burkholderiaceae bacterium]|nr:hypothetical protein [Burkholderiaceae bacterium]